MAGRRQVWTGITLFLLALALPAAALAAHPGEGWPAATVVATALLLAICARRMRAGPATTTGTEPAVRPVTAEHPVPAGLSPAAPGRPEQPRAPANAR
jgi:hypothetical protein